MLSGCSDGIGQSILSILIPSARIYINREKIRNLPAIVGQKAEETTKAIFAQQKSPDSSAWVILDNCVALAYPLAK